jgi:DNA replication protein DnaC
MNTETIDKMKAMKLHGMLRAFRANIESGKYQGYTADEFASMLVEAEWDERHDRKLTRSLKSARFRYKASVEQVYFDAERTLDKNQVMRLADCDFIRRYENVLITGSTGIGKSYLASALGHHACSAGFKVHYQHSTKLFAKLKLSKADGSYLRELSRMEKANLLIIDDFGIQPLDSQSRAALLEIMEDRHGKASTIFTSQLPVSRWHDVIGEQTIADAILDRIVHDSHRLELTGESMRKKRTKEEQKTEPNNDQKTKFD